MRTKLTFIFILFFSVCGYAQFNKEIYMINGYTLPYQVMYPQDFDETKQYPLVIFLHGAGERGSDNEKQLVHGKDFMIQNFQTKYPAIVIAPQCPENSYWSNVEKHSIRNKVYFNYGHTEKASLPMETLMYLIDSWKNSGHIDSTRIYAGGLSMGGMGTYELIWRMPDTFAAAFAICGGGDINKIKENTKNTAIWIFHGSADSVVPVKYSQDIYKCLLEHGNEVKYTEYAEVNHNSWDNAFKETELAHWLFNHKKGLNAHMQGN